MVMCFAPGCKHYSEREKCKYFKFPKEEKKKKHWMKLLGWEDKSPAPYSMVCSCHFKDGLKKNGPEKYVHNIDKIFLNTDPEEKNNTKTKQTLGIRTITIKNCIVPGCKINSDDNPEQLFHPLPVNEQKLKMWLTFVNRRDILYKSRIDSRNDYVCDAHFEAKHYMPADHTRLKRGACPTVRPTIEDNLGRQNDANPDDPDEICEIIENSTAHSDHSYSWTEKVKIHDIRSQAVITTCQSPTSSEMQSDDISEQVELIEEVDEEASCSVDYSHSTIWTDQLMKDMTSVDSIGNYSNSCKINESVNIEESEDDSIISIESDHSTSNSRTSVIENPTAINNFNNSNVLFQNALVSSPQNNDLKKRDTSLVDSTNQKYTTNKIKRKKQYSSIDNILDNYPFASHYSRTLVKMQCNANRAEWSDSERNFSVMLYYKSPEMYEFLRSLYITLPSPSLIKYWVDISKKGKYGYNAKLK